jgi:outer membrane lipoprotein-sorting protein
MRLGTFSMRFLAILLLAASAWPQQGAAQPEALERVLDQMDKTAAAFRTTEANFVWNQYQRVVDDSDKQEGRVYFRRVGKETQMAADITAPDKKYILFADDKVQVYQPKIDQVTSYNTGKNRADFESFLVLGFGGGGHDMLKSFDVKYVGEEKIDGVDTAKLDLVPKSAKVKNNFQHILLWIDPARGISIQQQLFAPSGDYRLAKYSDIQINQKIPDTVFKLKTTNKTKTVSPQG